VRSSWNLWLAWCWLTTWIRTSWRDNNE
jgi:hypothetical protein